MNYIYTGTLILVDGHKVKLENPSIVYETGDFQESQWKDAQALPKELCIRLNTMESYGEVK